MTENSPPIEYIGLDDPSMEKLGVKFNGLTLHQKPPINCIKRQKMKSPSGVFKSSLRHAIDYRIITKHSHYHTETKIGCGISYTE